MKKLIVISVITAAILALSIWEATYNCDTYKQMRAYAQQAQELLYGRKEGVRYDESIDALLDEMESVWNDRRNVVFLTGNHTVVKAYSERVALLRAYVDADAGNDAYSVAVTLEEASALLSTDSLPVWENLF